jgi:predicted RNase H-like HicB family nuclease
MKKRYLVVYEKCRHNFAGYVPDVPGCISTGRSFRHMREMMTEALEFHLSSMLCDGEEIPEPITTQFDFALDAEDEIVEYCIVDWLDVKIVKSVYRNAKKIEPGYSIIKAARRAKKAA